MSRRAFQKLLVASAVIAFVALIVFLVAPNFVRARIDVSRRPCIYILRCIDDATQTWAVDNGKSTNDIPTW